MSHEINDCLKYSINKMQCRTHIIYITDNNLYITDLNGNVKALQYALSHSLIYRDPHLTLLKQPQPPHRLVNKVYIELII